MGFSSPTRTLFPLTPSKRVTIATFHPHTFQHRSVLSPLHPLFPTFISRKPSKPLVGLHPTYWDRDLRNGTNHDSSYFIDWSPFMTQRGMEMESVGRRLERYWTLSVTFQILGNFESRFRSNTNNVPFRLAWHWFVFFRKSEFTEFSKLSLSEFSP